MVQGKQHPWEETGGHQTPPSTRPQPAQDTCSIPTSPFFSFPEHPDEGKRGVKAGAAQDLLIPGEISPLLTLGWGRMLGD